VGKGLKLLTKLPLPSVKALNSRIMPLFSTLMVTNSNGTGELSALLTAFPFKVTACPFVPITVSVETVAR
jgi:hypothetical protein